MSRYVANKGNEQIIYGFDECWEPGYFIEDKDGMLYDTRPFMASDDEDEPCRYLSRGGMVELLTKAQEHGFSVNPKHIRLMALDLRF